MPDEIDGQYKKIPERQKNGEILDGGRPEPEDETPEKTFSEEDGFDYRKLKAKMPMVVSERVQGDSAATAANYGVFFLAPFPLQVISVREAHESAATSGFLHIEKLTGTQALDVGAVVTNDTFDFSAAANTVVTGSLSSVFTSRLLVRGDRLALRDSGGLSGLSGATITVELLPAEGVSAKRK